MLSISQTKKINSAIRLAEISKFKPTTFKIGDKWSLNNDGEVIKTHCLLNKNQAHHKIKSVVNFFFDIKCSNKHWNQSRFEMRTRI
ncbi:hypothetical protein [Photobacterium leiognathi]|uniref:hypothetical protein n=1 Tax=Photobacterium leiognathi TaxID=553611 RepID=UPI0027386174|nr:hypothetical protein [Photobacterium leiognathi]